MVGLGETEAGVGGLRVEGGERGASDFVSVLESGGEGGELYAGAAVLGAGLVVVVEGLWGRSVVVGGPRRGGIEAGGLLGVRAVKRGGTWTLFWARMKGAVVRGYRT